MLELQPRIVQNVTVYSEQVLDHFQNARNVGELDDADARVSLSNPACGDVLQLAIKVEAGRVTAARFLARGCVSAVACGSQLTELITGKSLTAIGRLQQDDLVQGLGGLPQASRHAAALAIDVMQAALKQLEM